MDTNNKWEQVKGFFRKIGRRNLIIAGAVVVIGAAVALNWAFFSKANDHDGYDYKASAGMSTNYGTNLTTSAVGDDKSPTTPTGSDAYFSTVEVSRKKARDEAIEVLNAVVRNDKATEDVKAQAMQELQALAKDMEKEANIESLLQGKGFAKCLAVISGDNANIVVQNKGALQPAQLAQINAVVFEQTGIQPSNITIVQKDCRRSTSGRSRKAMPSAVIAFRLLSPCNRCKAAPHNSGCAEAPAVRRAGKCKAVLISNALAGMPPSARLHPAPPAFPEA